ncbi:ASCH domain-containing protein [Paraclostridium bifermentans]|uniref:ASCH domain-containing protein n=1 Tax=Paraclostridium bifermentans TaxID=1490 RepID=UPI0024B925D7|nr:ASCH domain-containing protein [Paraclostridium bifermentans]
MDKELYDLYKVDNESIPKKDEYSIVADWNSIAKCVIRTKDIFILPFKSVDERLANIEGEGYLSVLFLAIIISNLILIASVFPLYS